MAEGMSATRSSWRIAAIRAKIRLQGAGKEDFDMLKLFAGTLVVLSGRCYRRECRRDWDQNDA
jgi:hypothetical protein